MKRKSFGRDAGLSLRMLTAGGMLGLLYVAFAAVLFTVLDAGLITMLVIVAAMAIFQYYTSDKLALMASGAKVVDRDEAPALHDMVERLCAMADLPKPKVAVIDTDVPNAFATGRSPKHSAVAVTTGLWQRLEPREVEAVVAHELGHRRERHVVKWTALGMAAAAGAALALWLVFGADAGDPARVPHVLLLLAALELAALPAAAVLSRRWERVADRIALELTGDPGAVESAFRRFADANVADLDPPRLLHWLLATHPTLPERVAAARRFGTVRP